MITDLFWSFATSDIVLGLICVVTLAAGIISILPLRLVPATIAPYVLLAKIGFIVALFLLGLIIGHRLADERAETARLKIDLSFKEFQLENQKAAAEDAARLRQKAEAHAADLSKKVFDYEAQLPNKPSDACDLDDRDVNSLRGIAR